MLLLLFIVLRQIIILIEIELSGKLIFTNFIVINEIYLMH